MRTNLIRRIATGLLVTGLVGSALTNSSYALESGAGHTIDVDRIRVGEGSGNVVDWGSGSLSNHAPTGPGTVTTYYRGDRVKAEVNGTLFWDSTSDGCGFLRVYFHSNPQGAARQVDSVTMCSIEEKTKAVTVVSPGGWDVSKIIITTRRAGTAGRDGVEDARHEVYVGDSPQSNGADQLDTDRVLLSKKAMPIFDGQLTHRMRTDNGNIQTALTGKILWREALSGDVAWIKFDVGYADGTSTSVSTETTASAIRTDRPTQTVSLTTPIDKDVVHARVTVQSKSRLQRFLSEATVLNYFADGACTASCP